MSGKSSRNLYFILVLILSYLLFSISDFDKMKQQNLDWWLLVFLVSINVSTTIAITKISYIRAEKSPDYVMYKLNLHKLFDKHKENLHEVKNIWLEIKYKKYANREIYRLYRISEEVGINDFYLDTTDLFNCLLEGTYLETLEELGIVISKNNSNKTNRSIKIIKSNYKAAKRHDIKFHYAERAYNNGRLVKSYDLLTLKEIGQLLAFLFSTTISIFSLIKWDKDIILKLIVTLLFIGINIIVSFVETKEHKSFYYDYWEDIADALEEYDKVVNEQ